MGVNTRQVAEEYRLAHWAGIIRERSESGLTIKAFCEKAGFHQNIYFYWQRKLREAACGQLAVSVNKTAPASLATRGFTEVQISDTSDRELIPEAAWQGAIRAEVAGIRISADSAYPAAKLAELLSALSPC